jgi:hypothetical protein
MSAHITDIDLSNNLLWNGVTIAQTLMGDITGNGFVNILDGIQLSNVFGTSSGDKRWNPDADLNGSGTVDILDAILLAGNFLEHVP